MRRKIAVNPSEADKGQMKGLVEMINQSSDPMLILFNSVINSEMVKSIWLFRPSNLKLHFWVSNGSPLSSMITPKGRPRLRIQFFRIR